MVLVESEPQFNLKSAIGLPPEGIIFTSPLEKIDSNIFSTDEFKTSLVLKDSPEKYDPGLLYDLFAFSREIDNKINQTADNYPNILDPVESGQYRELVRLHSPELMHLIQKNFIGMLKISREKIEEYGREVVMAFPEWGSLAILRAMEKEGLPKEILIPADISGSVGTDTGHASAENLPTDLLDPKKVVFFPDDIFDTCVTEIELGIARAIVMAEQNGIKVNNHIFHDPDAFEDKMRLARKGLLPEMETEQVWKELAQLLWEVDVISAPFSIKNPPFAKAVIDLVSEVWSNPGSSDWDRQKAAIQGQLMFQTHYINPNHWIIGGRWGGIPLLDTKVRGQTIWDELSNHQEEYGIKSGQLENLKESGLDKLSLRSFSGLDGLWVFNPEGLSEDNKPESFQDDDLPYNQLVRFYADHLVAFARHRWPSEPHSLTLPQSQSS